jgi:hypothetical protein
MTPLLIRQAILYFSVARNTIPNISKTVSQADN